MHLCVMQHAIKMSHINKLHFVKNQFKTSTSKNVKYCQLYCIVYKVFLDSIKFQIQHQITARKHQHRKPISYAFQGHENCSRTHQGSQFQKMWWQGLPKNTPLAIFLFGRLMLNYNFHKQEKITGSMVLQTWQAWILLSFKCQE